MALRDDGDGNRLCGVGGLSTLWSNCLVFALCGLLSSIIQICTLFFFLPFMKLTSKGQNDFII